MKELLVMPVLAAVLFAAACDGGPTTVDTRPGVRFFNATTGMAGSGGFTMNGQFAAGSALALGQSTQKCSKVDAGSTSFGFGPANSGGTGLTGNALVTLSTQSVVTSGNYTVVATGSAASPQLYMIDNSYSGSLGPNEAAVRFLNLAPGPGALPHVYYVFTAWPPVEGALFASNVVVGSPTEFKTVASGTTSFSVIIGHQVPTLVTVPVNLQAGSVNTIAIAPNASGGYQLINIPRC